MTWLSDETVAAGLREAVRLRQGYSPTEDDLVGAPLISSWVAEPLPGASGFRRLAGYVIGHPTIGSGWCTTSALVAIDPARNWARTVSRYYRLGPTLDEVACGDG